MGNLRYKSLSFPDLEPLMRYTAQHWRPAIDAWLSHATPKTPPANNTPATEEPTPTPTAFEETPRTLDPQQPAQRARPTRSDRPEPAATLKSSRQARAHGFHPTE